MATTPSGFWYPSPGDTINSISGLFAQQAASSEAALNARILQDGVPKFADATARTAAYAGVPPLTGSMSYLESTGVYERWNGAAWVPLVEDRTLIGSVSVPPQGTYWGEASVTFPSGHFSSPPAVFTNSRLGSGTPTSVFVTEAHNVTASGFTMRIQTSQGTNFNQAYTIQWYALPND